MMLLRSRPRVVYRLYGEDEFLDSPAVAFSDRPAPALHDRAEPVTALAGRVGRADGGERLLRRIAGVAMLAGTVGVAGGVLVANLPQSPRGVSRARGGIDSRASAKVYRPGEGAMPRPLGAGMPADAGISHAPTRRAQRRHSARSHWFTYSRRSAVGATVKVASAISARYGASTPLPLRPRRSVEFGFEP